VWGNLARVASIAEMHMPLLNPFALAHDVSRYTNSQSQRGEKKIGQFNATELQFKALNCGQNWVRRDKSRRRMATIKSQTQTKMD